jgi:DNA-binding transcriptional ArsR family regulator
MDADIAAVATLFAEPARARMLMALGDGRSLPASALAAEAGVSAQGASAHLGRLREAGLITMERAGRHRYFRLAGPDVADGLESLARLAPAVPVRSLREATRAEALRRARTCYDHLAGELGVAITDALVDRGALEAGGDTTFRLGARADEVLRPLGVDLATVAGARSRRPLVRVCVDWTERRPHLAGRLGAALQEALVGRGWVVRREGHRAVLLTAEGEEELHRRLGPCHGRHAV